MIEPLVVGALLPLVLWILWRIQALVVDGVLRKGMFQLLRHQRRVYNVVSWCGVLLHELAHAIFLLLGGHGIKDFRVGRDAGHVTPRRLRKNLWGHGTFLIAALAPMFVAPVVVLALLLVARPDLVAFFPAQQPRFDAVGASFDGAPGVLLIFGSFLLGSVVPAMLGLDLAAPLGLAVFLVAVLAIPSARPSHVKNKGAEDEGDIAVLRATIKRRPWPTVAFLCLFTAASAVLACSFPPGSGGVRLPSWRSPWRASRWQAPAASGGGLSPTPAASPLGLPGSRSRWRWRPRSCLGW